MSEAAALIGTTPSIRALREEIEYASRCDAKVLITGESGAGKEIVARLIHSHSRRNRFPLVTVNCAALTESLLETELFGHVRGSFTGAYRDHAGVFERADGGSVFMDEIGETTPRMQGLLLRFLETGQLHRVGSDEPVPRQVNVRVIAATNRVLHESVAARTFREDLYYRLNVIHLQVPALRARREDIPALLEFFFRAFSRQYGVEQPQIASTAMAALTEYGWPGNVRELKNVVERTIVRSRSAVVEADHLPVEVLRRSNRPVSVPVPSGMAAPARSAADDLFDTMLNEGRSFWMVIYTPFMSRDLTRADLRAIIRRGLEQTAGNYEVLTELFNMPRQDYKRFLRFLRKHGCQLRFQDFRSAVPADRGNKEEPPVAASA